MVSKKKEELPLVGNQDAAVAGEISTHNEGSQRVR